MADAVFAELASGKPAPASVNAFPSQLSALIAKKDPLEWARANMDFHIVLAEACGNSVMTDAMSAVASHTMRVGFQLLREKGRMQEAYEEHLAIVEGCDDSSALLPLLMTLAEQQDDVARLCVLYGQGDGLGAVELCEQLTARLADACTHLLEDLLG